MNIADLLPDETLYVLASEKTADNIWMLTFVPENVTYVTKKGKKKHYPCILAFTSMQKAKKYARDQGGGGYRVHPLPLLDIIDMATDMPGNVAIDRIDDNSPFVWINIIAMMRENLKTDADF